MVILAPDPTPRDTAAAAFERFQAGVAALTAQLSADLAALED